MNQPHQHGVRTLRVNARLPFLGRAHQQVHDGDVVATLEELRVSKMRTGDAENQRLVATEA